MDNQLSTFLGSGYRPDILVSFVIGTDYKNVRKIGRDNIWDMTGLATVAQTPISTTRGGTPVFFEPLLTEWPVVTLGIHPEARTVDPIQTEIKCFIPQNSIIRDCLAHYQSGGFGRIDLLSPGGTLEQTMLLSCGQISSLNFNNVTGELSFTIIDGDSNKVEFPPGNKKLDRVEFPEMSEFVSGRYGRWIIYGDFPYPITCVPLDDGLTYYVADNILDNLPNVIVRVDGEVRTGWHIETRRYIDTKIYSVIVFDDRIPGEGDPLTLHTITIEGGRGVSDTENPIIALIKDIGQYEMDNESLAIISKAQLPVSILLGSADDVMAILQNRIMPQTNYVIGWRRGVLHIYSLDSRRAPRIALTVGDNLYPRTSENVDISDEGAIANFIEILYHRDPFTITDLSSAQKTMYMDKSHNSTTALASLLAHSERRYGRRPLRMEAPDIVTKTEAVPPILLEIGGTILRNSALQQESFEHIIPHSPLAYYIDLAWRGGLTDEDRGIFDKEHVVTKIMYRQEGVAIQLQAAKS